MPTGIELWRLVVTGILPPASGLFIKKEDSIIDANGNMTSDSSFWDEISGHFWSKGEHTYDENWNITYSIYYRWNETTSLWYVYSEEIYYYSEQIPTLSLI